MWPPFLLAGIGMGLVFAPSSTAVLANMTPADHAKASGTNSTLREIGVALGVAVLTAVFTGAGGTLTPTGYVDAAIPAVWVGAGVLALAAVISLALPSGIRRMRRAAIGTRAAVAPPRPARAARPSPDGRPSATRRRARRGYAEPDHARTLEACESG